MPSARLTPPTPTQDTGPPTHTSQPHTGHHGRGRGVPVGGVPTQRAGQHQGHHPPTRTQHGPGAGHTTDRYRPRRHAPHAPHPRSHRSPPERPTAHPQASTRTHNRQAASGPHTHAQPHRRDHHQPSQHQPPRPSVAATTTTKHQHQRTRARTTAARTAHNALTSTNTKHHAGEITTHRKTNPRQPRGYPRVGPNPTATRHPTRERVQVTDLNLRLRFRFLGRRTPGIMRKSRCWCVVPHASETGGNRPCRGS